MGVIDFEVLKLMAKKGNLSIETIGYGNHLGTFANDIKNGIYTDYIPKELSFLLENKEKENGEIGMDMSQEQKIKERSAELSFPQPKGPSGPSFGM
jgi:hypothetical protein